MASFSSREEYAPLMLCAVMLANYSLSNFLLGRKNDTSFSLRNSAILTRYILNTEHASFPKLRWLPDKEIFL
jgi:hypothetical protein